MNSRSGRAYDHRIKEQLVRTRNPDLFPELGIPRSTAERGGAQPFAPINLAASIAPYVLSLSLIHI